MPRPGPRPYECVRRAWHSDRHNPIRGSLIQEIFRIANYVHSPETRKNREWQEKLPVVVLRAEEILYSKANSEAEYADITTLWGRVNDAIDTIIRKDESTETEALLQPCIEAALHLGCTPRRSSRSQRNDSPRCYLRHEMSEPVPIFTSKNLMPTSSSYQSLRSSQYSPQSSLISRFKAANYSHMQSRNCNLLPATNFLGPSKEFTSSREHHAPEPPPFSPPSSWAVYPLYYNNCTQLRSELYSSRPCPSTTAPSYLSRQNNEAGVRQNFLSSSRPTGELILGVAHDGNKCDLTLRLGPVVHSCASVEDHHFQS